MASDTNDLRAHALHQKSKEAPEVPRITKEEAAILRLHSIPFSHYYAMLHADNRGLLDIRSGSLTPLGRAALAQFEAEQRAEIRREAIASHALVDAARRLADVERRLDDVEQRRVRLSDTDFDALDDAWHGAIADVCRAVREVQP